MTDRQRVVDFIRSFGRDQDDPLLISLREEAKKDGVPIIRRETEDLLGLLLGMQKPDRILEVGTAIGYSALFMAGQTDARITTIENYPPRLERAKIHFREAGMEERICLLEGDAADILPGLSGPYDFIFMDAAKGQYIHFLPQVLRLLAPGGLLVSDNVLQDGDIYESRYAIRRRNHTIHSRMREYLYALTHRDDLYTVILETGDGMSVSRRKGT